jgi:ribonuclease HI
MKSLFLTFEEEFRAHAGRSASRLVVCRCEDGGLGRGGRPLHLRRGLRSQAPRLDARMTGEADGEEEVGAMSDSAVGAQGAITESPRPKPGLYTLHTDGGIVAAPGQAAGEAAIGAVLKNSDNLLVEAISESIGRVDDHHIAEFRALVEGLTMAKRHTVDKIRVFTDSELLVRSVLDDVNLKSAELRELGSKARELYLSFADRELSWVPREMNTEADLLAGAALPLRPSRG